MLKKKKKKNLYVPLYQWPGNKCLFLWIVMTTAWPVSGQHPAQVSLTDTEIIPQQAHFYGVLRTEQGEQDQAD